jgi:methionyl-tRNA synthetase
MPRPILVTSALPYANGPIHLGHLAGAYLPADLYVRYLRLKGEDVVYVCGSDEMGVAILMRAHQEGRTPREVIDTFHPVIEQGLRAAGMSFDHYGRTSSPVHHQTAARFFEVLAGKTLEGVGGDQGVFRLRTEQQLFDPVAGVFLADRFVRGTCPVCGNPDAYGDQCEVCGSTLSPAELGNPRSALSDATPEPRETTHWYLPLGDAQPMLEAWLNKTWQNWKPNVTGQIRSWLQEGLRDRAITRDIAWGVRVPEAVAEAAGVDASGKVIYVWFDAPIGYVSATKEWAAAQGDPERWRRYWQGEGAEAPRLIHFIGKDNIVFHGLVFPAMLMLHGQGPDDPAPFVLPENVPANEFLNLEGQKFSTSRGWAIWLHEFLDRFPADYVRYGLAATLPETKDADFSLKDFQARINNDLADVIGNFVNRALTFAHRYFDGAVPEAATLPADAQAVIDELSSAPTRIAAHYDAFRFRDAVVEAIGLARVGNKYFNDAAPWHQIKQDRQAAADTIYTALQLCASLSILLEPVVPEGAARLRRMLNMDAAHGLEVRRSTPVPNDEHEAEQKKLGLDDAARPLLPPGHKLGTPEVLFQKLDDTVIQDEMDRLHRQAGENGKGIAASAEGAPRPPDQQEQVLDVLGHAAAPTPEAAEAAAHDAGAGDTDDARPYAPPGETITIDDFAKLDLRAARVVVAERIPKADKLLRLEVDLGYETRQILSGIAEHFAPEDVQGRTVVIVANLAPRKMRGLESQGMILMAEDRDGRLRFVETDGEPGATVK